MSNHQERLGLGRRSRLAGGMVALAVAASLAVSGCSVITAMASHQAPRQATANLAGSNPGPVSSSSSVVPPNPHGPPADPFTGTPADHWADGAAGIVIPAAKAAGPFSASQAEYAYQTARKMLIAADLNTQTLLGGAPSAFAQLLTSPQRTWFEQGLNKRGTTKNGDDASTRTQVMSFAPGSTQLVGNVIKVNGTMHGKAKTFDGHSEFEVTLDYLFVYPIEPPHHPDSWMRIVNEVAWTVDFGNWKGASSKYAPWLSSSIGSGISGTQCGTTDGYSHPDYPTNVSAGATPTETPSGNPIDPYISGQPRSGKCELTTGT